MTDSSTWYRVLLAVLLLAAAMYRFCDSKKRKNALPLPPGPSGLPIIGMTAKVLAPGKKHATLFEEWDKEYGGKGILLVPTLFRNQIIISDAKAAQALLEKRGPMYTDRAPAHFFDKLRANGLNLVAMEGGPNAEKIRKLFHEEMSPKAVTHWEELQTSNAYHTALELLGMKHGDTVADVVEKTQKELTIRTFCGHITPQLWQDVSEIEVELDRIPVPAIAPLLDLFPSLKRLPSWFPGASYHQDVAKYRSLQDKLWNSLRDSAKRQANDPLLPATIWGNLYKTDAFARYGFSDDEASYVVGHQLGSNFVPAAIMEVFVLAMLRFPQILKKAQEEIDRVIGRDRLPTIEDEQSLPYIRALQLEVLRWRPVVPLVQPHLASQDDEYAGYRIPKGSLVWANLQGMSRNEAVYPDANSLKPERFLTEDGAFARRDEISIFGYGRRRCPGAYLANPILFLNIATLVWAMDMSLPDGVTELPSDDVEKWYTYITFVVPPPFKAKMIPRDARVTELLQEFEGDWKI